MRKLVLFAENAKGEGPRKLSSARKSWRVGIGRVSKQEEEAVELSGVDEERS